MTDGPDDGNRTIIIRPTPGRRQPNAVPAAGEMPQAARRELPTEGTRREPAVESSIAPAASTAKIPSGEDGLLVAAAPLLQLMARVHNSARPPDSGDLREWTVRQIRIFEREAADRGVEPDQLRAAHYAICIGLDDVVLNTPWGSRDTWRTQPLIALFHRESGNQERFFEVLRQMCNNPRKSLPVIKLMYLCLSLGFVGRYRASVGGGAADIKRIRDEVHAIIARQEKAADPELAPHVKGVRAPHRPTRARMPLWVAASAGLGLVAALFAWFAFSLNSDSDLLQAQARDMPPARMPDIARAPFVETPPAARQPLPPPEPSALDKVRNLLRPDIERGLVEVGGTAAQPIVRINAGSLFAPGSATALPAAKPLLGRIAQVLGTESGRVRVIAYTDDRSTRSMAFPSNAHLSAAQAQASGAIVAAGIGDASRVSFEGRADAEPIASNATSEGRERNRRIEIVLSRQGP